MESYAMFPRQEGREYPSHYKYPLSDRKNIVWTRGERDDDPRLRYDNVSIVDDGRTLVTLRYPFDFDTSNMQDAGDSPWRFATTVEQDGKTLCDVVFYGDEGARTAAGYGITTLTGELSTEEIRRFKEAMRAEETNGSLHPESSDEWTYSEESYVMPDSTPDEHVSYVSYVSIRRQQAERASDLFRSKLEYHAGRLVGATIDDTTVRLPSPLRLLGGSLNDLNPVRRRLSDIYLLVCLVASVASLLVAWFTDSEMTRAVAVIMVVLFLMLTLLTSTVGDLLMRLAYKHLPLLPCPCCGEPPELTANLFWVTAHHDSQCGVIPDGEAPDQWNGQCLDYARLTSVPCSACGMLPEIDYDAETGQARQCRCACAHSYTDGTVVHLLEELEYNRRNAECIRKAKLRDTMRSDNLRDARRRYAEKLSAVRLANRRHRTISITETREEPCVKTTD